jgi:hypothetical protein
MTIEHYSALTRDEIHAIKQAVKAELIRLATRDGKTNPEDWVIRRTQVIEAAPHATIPPGAADLAVKTSQIADQNFWAQDAADITADVLSSILAANAEVPDNKYIGFFGMADLSPTGGELIGLDSLRPSLGNLIFVRFERGGNYLDLWNCEHLYLHPIVNGYSFRPVVYEEKDKPIIKGIWSEATLDKYVLFHSYICERRGEVFGDGFRPHTKEGGSEYQPSTAPRGFQGELRGLSTMEPIQEIPLDQQRRVKNYAQAEILRRAMAKLGGSAQDYIIRELNIGDVDGANAANANILDLDFRTIQTSGQMNSAIDAGDTTALAMSSVLVAQEKINSNNWVAIFGFWDKTPNPNLVMSQLKSGGTVLQHHQVEHCYIYPAVEGMVEFPEDVVFFDEDKSIDWLVSQKASQDAHIGLRGYVCERKGDIVGA